MATYNGYPYDSINNYNSIAYTYIVGYTADLDVDVIKDIKRLAIIAKLAGVEETDEQGWIIVKNDKILFIAEFDHYVVEIASCKYFYKDDKLYSTGHPAPYITEGYTEKYGKIPTITTTGTSTDITWVGGEVTTVTNTVKK